jgi:hypothetical protein
MGVITHPTILVLHQKFMAAPQWIYPWLYSRGRSNQITGQTPWPSLLPLCPIFQRSYIHPSKTSSSLPSTHFTGSFNIILWSSSRLVKVSGRGTQHLIYSGSPLAVNVIMILLLISAYHRPCGCILRFSLSTQIPTLWRLLHLIIYIYRRLCSTPPCWFLK